MNCPDCNRSYAADTFTCPCGCIISSGERALEVPAAKITPHGVLATWRFLQMMIGAIVVTGAGIGMILIDAWLYGIFLICAGIAVFGFAIWVTLRAR
jgi:hypothetical protein